MGHVLLEWKGHDHALGGGLWEFFNEEYLVDFSITCHGLCIKVHKVILVLIFPVLKESLMTCEDGSSIQLKELNLDFIANHAEDMRYLLELAYTGSVRVPSEHKDCLHRIASMMGSDGLKESLMEGADSSNVSEPQLSVEESPEQSEEQCETTSLDCEIEIYEVAEEVEGHDGNDNASRSTLCAEDTTSKKCPEAVGRTKSSAYFREYYRKRRVLTCDKCNYETRYPYRLKAHIHSKHDDAPTMSESTSSSSVHVDSEVARTSSEVEDAFRAAAPAADPSANVAVVMDSSDSQDDVLPGAVSASTRKLVSSAAESRLSPDLQYMIPELKCLHCDYVASKAYYLKLHMVCHTGKNAKQHVCKQCKKVFGTSNMLKLHQDAKCGFELPQKCKYCGHQTWQRAVLLQHMAVKHKVDGNGNPLKKNVRCQQCSFVCFARHQLLRHVQSKHVSLNRYKCEECNYMAPFRSEMSKHVRIMHQKRRDFMCDACGFRSQTSSGLVRHVLRLHENIKPHRCDVCGAEYCDSTSFKLHREKHDGLQVRRFVCHVCGQTFLRRSHLRTHCRCKHKVDLEPAKPNYEFVKANDSAAPAEEDSGAVETRTEPCNDAAAANLAPDQEIDSGVGSLSANSP